MLEVFKTKRFFTQGEKEQIVAAIAAAERLTSGEIRVHVESGTGKDPVKRAQEVFSLLGMDRTELHNGVLIYLAIKDRKFAIIGDRGIDQVVPGDFWEDTKSKMQQLFKTGKFAAGVCLGISLAGEHLARHFPYQAGDVNELSNDISEGV